jgi:hypothetical protein
VATGDARSTLLLDTGTSIGRAPTITYVDATRTITYAGTPSVVAARGNNPASTPAPAVAPAVLAQLSRAAQEDLRAVRIEIVLGAGSNKAERLEAYQQVSLKAGKRTATGARLTYFSADERYLMTGTAPRTSLSWRTAARLSAGR